MDSPNPAFRSPSFWRAHAIWPLFAFVLVFGLDRMIGLDRWLANAWFFDPVTGSWLGSGAGDWWAHRLLHDQGRWLVRGIGGAALIIWATGRCLRIWRGWQTRAGFVALSMVAPVVLVGALKAITDVDCPWALAGFGGHNPDIPLLAARPDYLPPARCFPGAHSASGFALLCFYFAWRDDSPTLARFGLIAGIAVGVLFAVGQEARGAHFFSHDLASAAVVWFVQLGLYVMRPAAEPGGTALPHRPDVPPGESGGRRGLRG